MLQSLEVRNYRNLRHLTIEKLGRVNLLVGKNNTGKTSVLEAVGIYVNKGNIDFILQLLDERGENYINRKNIEAVKELVAVKTVTSLFTDRKSGFSEITAVSMGELEESLLGLLSSTKHRVTLKFVRYTEMYEDTVPNQPQRRRRIFLEEGDDSFDAQLGIEIRMGNSVSVIPFTSFDRLYRVSRAVNSPFYEEPEIFQFVKTKNIERETNGFLWDQIALTESENEVVNALKIIESDIERVTFRGERESQRAAVVKLRSSNDVVPLRAMGDGINRILTIILAMVNCENGYLLIDEFENGLHYSVQEKLWEVIFHLSQRLNIQVFATTHSSDAIHAFTKVANAKPENQDAQLIKLRNAKGEISAVSFNAQELLLADEAEYIEFR